VTALIIVSLGAYEVKIRDRSNGTAKRDNFQNAL
jgi:hypothetical protein